MRKCIHIKLLQSVSTTEYIVQCRTPDEVAGPLDLPVSGLASVLDCLKRKAGSLAAPRLLLPWPPRCRRRRWWRAPQERCEIGVISNDSARWSHTNSSVHCVYNSLLLPRIGECNWKIRRAKFAKNGGSIPESQKKNCRRRLTSAAKLRGPDRAPRKSSTSETFRKYPGSRDFEKRAHELPASESAPIPVSANPPLCND